MYAQLAALSEEDAQNMIYDSLSKTLKDYKRWE